ncbi:hypothetical protein JOQ06_023073 [Pogonophryne albipinna]|uniref:Ig-like domain-containing protein n=1 Tax=Pogonophryne albipinna TaxID=1090488 RepID=A0AAD6F3G7_9TELE|nr:hypothetical protein JOQ06_023073 [Pogonophryne albipinna]
MHQLTLSVQVPISNVSLTASATDLVEFNDTAVLTCSVLNGTSLSYVWMKGSTEVAVGAGVQLSDEGATLIMVGVTRYDEGSYRCNVSNGVSDAISPPVHLNIYYGPSNTTMTITPMRSAYITGSNISLSCSAESNPPAGVQWMLNGVNLNHFDPELQLEMVAENKSGNYKCILHNTVTSRFTSESGMIRIFTPIAAVVVNPIGGPPILHEQYILHCEVTGYVGNIQWSRNGQPITADNTTVIDMTNRTLLLKPVQLSDNGNYRCEASSPVSNMTSHPYTVEVNYGPMTPVIAAPSMALTGQMVTLNCSSDSHPPSHISWYFNGSLQATTSELVIGPLTFNMSGQYTCMAHNNITCKNSSADTMLTILAPVTMASIKIVGAQPIMNHTFTLTCETAGSVHYIGCEANNALSHFVGPIFSLEVFYGPEMPAIMGPNAAKRGDNATFSCYASSNPLCSYEWFFNGFVVSNASEYVASLLTDESSVMYTCMAYNNITGKNSTADKMLTVFDPIEDVQIETPMNPAIIVTFNPLELNDTGLYQCMALNPFWNKTSPSYMLLINYGPETPMIDGPAFAEEGHSAVFTCSAKSVPPSDYNWWFNGSSVANSSVFTTDPLSSNMSGEYTCLAYNM